MNEPKEKVRGWWYPIFLINLYESRVINAEEFMLLGKINSFTECQVNNKWLAEWWGKSPHWTSDVLSKLRKMGLLRIKITGSGKRLIETCFKGDEGWDQRGSWKNRRVLEKQEGGPGKTGTDLSIAKAKEINTFHAARSARGVCDSFGLNGQVKLPSIITRFNELSITNRWYVGMKGSNGKGWTHQTLVSWAKLYQKLKEELGGDVSRIKEVFNWFAANKDLEFTPKAMTFRQFFEKFCRIEDAMKRSTKQERSRIDPEDAEMIRDYWEHEEKK